MKREVHKLKHEAAKHLVGVSKKAKEYGPEAHKHVMSHLKEHAKKLAGILIDKGADAAANYVKGADPTGLSHGLIDKVKEVGKDKIKGALKKAVPGMGSIQNPKGPKGSMIKLSDNPIVRKPTRLVKNGESSKYLPKPFSNPNSKRPSKAEQAQWAK